MKTLQEVVEAEILKPLKTYGWDMKINGVISNVERAKANRIRMYLEKLLECIFFSKKQKSGMGMG